MWVFEMPVIAAIKHNAEQMWRIASDRRFVRFALQELAVPGRKDPLKVDIEFDAAAVDRIIERLLILRSQMLPKRRPKERH